MALVTLRADPFYAVVHDSGADDLQSCIKLLLTLITSLDHSCMSNGVSSDTEKTNKAIFFVFVTEVKQHNSTQNK